MNWFFSDLYADTGNARYLALSKRWHDKTIEDPLALGHDCLPGKHANTQFPKICGLAARYPYTGELADRNAAEFFWDRVVNHHSYVTGGNSEAELFGPPDKLSDRLSPADTELCNSYNMIRLTQLLFYLDPKAAYADYAERVLFNHILAAQHPGDGRICYFTPLIAGCPRKYKGLYDRFACCTCSGFDSYAKHAEFIYAHSAEALFVNLLAASEVDWRDKGVRLRQDTRFPDEETMRFSVACDRPVEFTLCLRCPAWCASGVAITLNGVPQPIAARSGSYAAIKRLWKSGDSVTLRCPMTLRTEAMPDNANRVAFFAGPILLAAGLDASIEPDDEVSAPVLIRGAASLTSALVAVPGKPLEFTLTGIARPRDVGLRPFFRLHDQPYVIYWDVLTESGWARQQAEHKARIEAARVLDEQTIDRVLVGDKDSELAHQMQGKNTRDGHGAYGKHPRRQWRDATPGGWFSYDLAVQPGQPAGLLCTYWGREIGARTFDILVNGTAIATQSLDGNHPEDFYDVAYPIPAELIKDATKITVTFKPHADNIPGGLFGIRTMKR